MGLLKAQDSSNSVRRWVTGMHPVGRGDFTAVPCSVQANAAQQPTNTSGIVSQSAAAGSRHAGLGGVTAASAYPSIPTAAQQPTNTSGIVSQSAAAGSRHAGLGGVTAASRHTPSLHDQHCSLPYQLSRWNLVSTSGREIPEAERGNMEDQALAVKQITC